MYNPCLPGLAGGGFRRSREEYSRASSMRAAVTVQGSIHQNQSHCLTRRQYLKRLFVQLLGRLHMPEARERREQQRANGSRQGFPSGKAADRSASLNLAFPVATKHGCSRFTQSTASEIRGHPREPQYTQASVSGDKKAGRDSGHIPFFHSVDGVPGWCFRHLHALALVTWMHCHVSQFTKERRVFPYNSRCASERGQRKNHSFPRCALTFQLLRRGDSRL